jgi:hypothetical protein
MKNDCAREAEIEPSPGARRKEDRYSAAPEKHRTLVRIAGSGGASRN